MTQPVNSIPMKRPMGRGRFVPPPVPRYVKAGVTDGWKKIEVVDLETGDLIQNAIEVNCDEGWLIQAVCDSAGNVLVDRGGKNPITRRREGKFELRWRKSK